MLPSWYDASNVGTLRNPNLQRAAEDGFKFGQDNNIPASVLARDSRVILSIIDEQNDFVSPDGALCVPGAVKDTDRLNRFIYSNIAGITHILASLDTHYQYQCFHPFNWIAGPNNPSLPEGAHPAPFTVITLDNLNKGIWRPSRNANRMRDMIKQLETNAKKMLCI